MADWMCLVLIASAMMIAVTESGMIPNKPLSVMLDDYGNPVMLPREKRTAVRPYPQRTMMFTGYYRPVVRRSSNGGQATGLFAQGNAVSGEAFFGDVRTPRPRNRPETIEQPEVSRAEAQAAPLPEEEGAYNEDGQGQSAEEDQRHYQEEERGQTEEEHHRRHPQDSLTPQDHQEPEQIPFTTEIAQPAKKPVATNTGVSATRPKVRNTKKTQKTPVVNVEEDEDDEDEADEENDVPVVPFVPFGGNKRRQGYPNLSNFFPMVFSFPRVATRAGSSDSLPGTITAIANSYSTSKGGVASSVATAYGGSPTGKKRRQQQPEE